MRRRFKVAKHPVKCFYCGITFDANAEPFEKVNSRRYAHKTCHEQHLSTEDKTTHDKRILEEYIKKLFNYDTLPQRVNKQIQNYVHEKEYTYSGIYKTLRYFFEVRGNTIEKANGGIGIVPYVYEEAKTYWRALWEAQQQNAEIDSSKYVLPAREVHILPPERKPMKHYRRLFTFLDEEVEE